MGVLPGVVKDLLGDRSSEVEWSLLDGVEGEDVFGNDREHQGGDVAGDNTVHILELWLLYIHQLLTYLVNLVVLNHKNAICQIANRP